MGMDASSLVPVERVGAGVVREVEEAADVAVRRHVEFVTLKNTAVKFGLSRRRFRSSE